MTTNTHVSVLLAESVAALAIQPAGIYLDATFGRGGHSRAILAALGPQQLLRLPGGHHLHLELSLIHI